jgi:methionine-rich copper-binding protein CopC
LNLRNRPYFYAAPTASKVCAFVNVDPTVTPLRLRFGSALSNADSEVKVGKDNSRYLEATGIMLLPGQSENLEFQVKMPTIEGRYRLWLDILAAEGASASFRTYLEVRT